MKRCALAFLLLLTATGCQSATPTATNIKLHSLFCDNMVLQRGITVPVWGKADKGGIVTVELNDTVVSARAGEEGIWMAKLPAMKAGGPYEMTIAGTQKTTLKNILVGDVWICSGQSNMQWSLRASRNAPEEIEAAKYPEIRLFKVRNTVSDKPEYDVVGRWDICTPATVPHFSAVGYFFGRDLHKALNVPQGLISTSWGGTPAEAWTPIEVLQANPECAPILERYAKAMKNYPAAQDRYKTMLANWEKGKGGKADRSRHRDPGNKGVGMGWAKVDFDDTKWKTMKLPMPWDSVMDIDGAVWFRRKITIPADWAGKELMLSLGAIDDFDVTYLNGAEVGATGEDTPNFWSHPRTYTIDGKLVKAGEAVIAVRVFDHYGGGGFAGTAEQMTIGLKSGGKQIALAGNWRYMVSIKMDPGKLVPTRRPRPPMGPGNPHSPAGLYNAMINPLVPYGIRGAIWYQGESNASRAYQYRKLFASMISAWRRVWKQGDFPFFTVQLANFMAPTKEPVESAWAELREAQLMTLTALPNTGLAVIIDIGEEKDIHPRNKQDVGKRLSLAARAIAYGEKLTYSGPLYKKMEIEGNRIRLYFDHVGDGLVARGGPLKYFAIAGKDKKFVWGKAVIEGDTVIVENANVKEPVAVRYAWANNPEGCNLYNKSNLPASPFRTDEWKGVTADRF